MMTLKLASLISEEEIQTRVKEIGAAINDELRGQDITAIGVLRGSFMFYADLIRELDANVSCEFLGVASYHGGTQSSGEVKLTLDLAHPIQDQHILLIEDIVDTGLTMNYLLRSLKARQPKSITTVALLRKPDAMKIDCKVDHVGFDIRNEFVVGYGLDYQGFYRNLPYIAQVHNIN